jgi:hypothetical protein
MHQALDCSPGCSQHQLLVHCAACSDAYKSDHSVLLSLSLYLHSSPLQWQLPCELVAVQLKALQLAQATKGTRQGANQLVAGDIQAAYAQSRTATMHVSNMLLPQQGRRLCA